MATLDTRYVAMAPIQEYFVDKDSGLPLSNGVVTFYRDAARTTLKPIYKLTGSASTAYTYTQLPNPLTLSGVGTFIDPNDDSQIIPYLFPYLGTPAASEGVVDLYYITVYSEDGVFQLDRVAWPNIGAGGGGGGASYGYNFVRNGTFFGWQHGTNFADVKTGSGALTVAGAKDIYFPDDWSYSSVGATATLSLTRETFALSTELLPNNPPYYLQYVSTGGTGQTANYLWQHYKNVKTLSGKQITVSIWLNQPTGTPSGMTIDAVQSYGTGGSPTAPVTTNVITVPLISQGTWTQYTGTVTLPVASGTLGTDGDDGLILQLNLPLNVAATIWIGEVQMQQGDTLTVNFEESNDDIQRGTNTYTLLPPFTTGDTKTTLKTVADPGWLMMNDQTIGNLGSSATSIGWGNYALYRLIWTNVTSQTTGLVYTPMFTDAGVPVTAVGASADADWAANRRLSLTKTLGRVLAGANPTPTPLATLTFDSTKVTDDGTHLRIELASTASIYTATKVRFTTSTGSLPTNLVAATDYYVIINPNVANTIFIALNSGAGGLANALAGSYELFSAAPLTTGITFVDSGTGGATFSLIVQATAHPFGSFLGEDTHDLPIQEIPSHAHNVGVNLTNHDVASGAGALGVASGSQDTASTGGNQPHNNIQPTTYLNVMIKL